MIGAPASSRPVRGLPARFAAWCRQDAGGPAAWKAALLLLIATSAFATSSSDAPKLPGNADVIQKLNTQLPLDLMFRDEEGKVVRLGHYFNGERPVVLHFMYHRCPMLCSIVLDGLSKTMSELRFDVGKDYDVISVSVDPRDKPSDSAAAKEKYIRRYGRLGAATGWHFLTGTESAIKVLADAVGFQFAYDSQQDQFAHGAAIMVMTPTGKISRYFYGFEYKARDLRLGLAEASAGKIGGLAERVLLLCFHYDPAVGKYSRNAMNFMRAGGVATMLSLGGFIFVMVRRERQGTKTS